MEYKDDGAVSGNNVDQGNYYYDRHTDTYLANSTICN